MMKRAAVIVLGVLAAGVAMVAIGCSDRFAGLAPSTGEMARPAPAFARIRTAEERTPTFRKPLAYPGEELWIIEQPPASPAPPAEDVPGSGELRAKVAGQEKDVPLPLKHTDVKAAISGYIATVQVRQQYHNPYDEKIEAVYVFPLPHNAAVSEFVMTVGERRIRGIIREREEAERIYQEARGQGYVASLLTQERPNVFTQSVANIEPGKAIDIDIKYFHTLRYSDGEYEFVFPMVVGPRFNPPGMSTGVGAVARGAQGTSGQKTEVQYLSPNERSGHDIALRAEVDAGVAIEKIWSPSHAVETQTVSASRATVALTPHDRVPNKDFVLRYRVAGRTVKSALLVDRAGEGGYFTLLLQPPADLADLPAAPQEMIFVLDCSGSMSGVPIAKSKDAVRRALKRLRPDDTFQIITFSNNASQFGPAPIAGTPANVHTGLAYIDRLEGEGGTMMMEGIKAALDFPHDDRRLRTVSFLTDGYVGNDREILGEVEKRLGASRLFSFGVGSSVNRYLLEGMARIGRGAVAFVGLDGQSGVEAVDRFYDRIRHPGMTDIQVDWGGLKVTGVYPQRIPDLFVGRPVVLTGRFTGTGKTVVRVRGKVGGKARELAVPVDLDGAESHAALAQVWARMRIADLEDRATWSAAPEQRELAHEIKKVALEFGLMSEFTAFVAVDSATRTAGAHGTTVPVAVPVPEGVKYETTVQEREE
jgi:Ca-activated chloride channel family protein